MKAFICINYDDFLLGDNENKTFKIRILLPSLRNGFLLFSSNEAKLETAAVHEGVSQLMPLTILS